ncbi:D-2-hydroxyglutarate dehydrogenase YdiJ [Thalassotalea agarivorans]|uniref:D-2-hydroxyglutarate dehydrogenase n=1 Tax=Thalassotalea agarivorans TaxID=349064 RepID=A0A1I0DB21_THASX|nr:FAD-binding and (Fe-S)-binding domain-containing protein [Thalassotalea agarivorans]SET29489.1 FAD/FMN-containing dehydrogenase [Thalassotalea agarivorans]
MLPKLDAKALVAPKYLAFADALTNANFSGDIHTQYSARLAVATDNSVYQKLPQLVILPRSIEDVTLATRIASEARFNDIKFSARGGGTGTNGQSLTPGIVMDLSKYMNNILEINVEENWVRVQAGVVKDQLNDFLKPHGFFFSPDLSTSNRATIGGMVNTDASGQGSLVYGKTSDHVLGLTSVLANGDVLETNKLPIDDAKALAKERSSLGRITNQVLTTCLDNRQKILEKFPRLNRFLTGYDLENVFDDELSTFDLSRVITGSEGSLAVVCEAKLNLTPIATYKTLVNVKYDSFDSALRHAPQLVAANATSVETIDSKVLNLAREDIIWHSVSDLIKPVPNQVMDGINMVEYNSENEADIADKIAALEARLNQDIEQGKGVIGYQITSDKASILKLYAMRKKAVGLLGNVAGNKKPIAFAEDTAVPPEQLADFIAEFRALLDSHGLDYGMFGHVDAGVLHVRPAMDMCDPEQEALLRDVSDQVVALTAKYGGLMWGEHGKGYRSEYGPEFFGEELFLELRKVKAAFDPLNKMNPGKICTPIDSNEQLVSVDDTKRGYFDRQIPVQVKEAFPAPMNCNGNGLCFNYDVNSPMCPSSKVTRDRRHSPKGRAGLMREWLRLAENVGVDLYALEDQKRFSIRALLSKAKVSWLGDNKGDFSHEVMDAMKGCLACKACASQCPIKVDVPDFRAKFINFYHSRYFRPATDHLVASVETMAPLMAKLPKFTNAVLSSRLYQGFSKRALGYVDTPLLSVPTLNEQVAELNIDTFNLDSLSQLSDESRQQYVAVVQDPFTSFYDANVVVALIKTIAALGFKPLLLPFKPNGKPQHVKGFLSTFAKTAQSSADFLNKVAELDIPLVGVDASLVLCYRDEYNQILGDKRGAFNVLVSHEWLHQQLQQIPSKQGNESPYYLFAHCTEKTALATSESQWQGVFEQAGLALNKVAVGCCGMAGTYGHEAVNQSNSKSLFDMSWQPKLESLASDRVLATGFSCRSQVKRYTKNRAQHPIEVLANWLTQ